MGRGEEEEERGNWEGKRTDRCLRKHYKFASGNKCLLNK